MTVLSTKNTSPTEMCLILISFSLIVHNLPAPKKSFPDSSLDCGASGLRLKPSSENLFSHSSRVKFLLFFHCTFHNTHVRNVPNNSYAFRNEKDFRSKFLNLHIMCHILELA